MPGTTTAQARVLQAVIQYKTDNDGCAPTIRELKTAVGLASESSIYLHLRALEARGLIVVDPAKARCIKVVGAYWSPPRPQP